MFFTYKSADYTKIYDFRQGYTKNFRWLPVRQSTAVQITGRNSKRLFKISLIEEDVPVGILFLALLL